MTDESLTLTEVWRTCNKIRSAIFRYGLNLWQYYTPLDTDKSRLLSVTLFQNPLRGPLKDTIGLCDEEICHLTQYFMVPDGRVLYTQFCTVIHGGVPDLKKNVPLVTGLEWEDPFHVRCLGPEEEARISTLLKKMAAVINSRRLVLRPYFQDYELVSKNPGTVALGHFARVLYYLGMQISTDDYNLLVKKFLKDNYCINYVAFVACLDNIINKLNLDEMLRLSKDVLREFPGKPLCAELPKIPRPEVGTVRTDEVFGTPYTFHPVLLPPCTEMDLKELLQRIQKYVFSERVRIRQFFDQFDTLRTGRITESQFRRGVSSMGASGIEHLYLSSNEMDLLVTMYRDPNDPSLMCYLTFEDDVDQVFTLKCLEKCPTCVIDPPPIEILELPHKGERSWFHTSMNVRSLCEDTIQKMKQRTMKRSIDMKPLFSSYDRLRSGHVTRGQFRQVILSVGIKLTALEMDSLEARYLNERGFNYIWFLQEVAAKPYEEHKFKMLLEEYRRLNGPRVRQPPVGKEMDIVHIMAKIKKKVVAERIRVQEFLEQYDPLHQQTISREDFTRGLSVCNLQLTENEMDTIMDLFASQLRRELVDYRRFITAVEEAFHQPNLERSPLLVPLQHLPSRDTESNFLDYDERKMLSQTIDKIVAFPDMDLLSLFKDYDRCNVGSVTSEQLMKALAVRGLLDKISDNERRALEKCFGVERGMRTEIDYRALIQTLNHARINSRRRVF